jgi:hypothetical protein
MSKSVIKFNNLDVSCIIFNKLEDNPRVKSQKLGYIRYKESNNAEDISLKIQTPEIDAETYGIPREGPYYPDAKSRSFFKFPFCHERKKFEDTVNYNMIEQFYDKLIEIDEYCNTDNFRKIHFGDKNYNKFSYQPLVRIPENDDDEQVILDKNGEPYYRPPYTKIKLDLEYNSDPENQSTKPIFSIFEKDKQGKRTKIELNSFDDVIDIIKYRSKLRFIISFSKLYAMKTASGTEKKKYGIILKATHIEIEKKENMSLIRNQNEDAFIDSDTDEGINKLKPSISRKQTSLDINEDENDLNEENSNEEENKEENLNKENLNEDEDEDEVLETVPKKKTVSKAKSKSLTK